MAEQKTDNIHMGGERSEAHSVSLREQRDTVWVV